MIGGKKKEVAIVAEEVMQKYQQVIASSTYLLVYDLESRIPALNIDVQAEMSCIKIGVVNVDLELQPVLQHKFVAMMESFQPRDVFASADVKKGTDVLAPVSMSIVETPCCSSQ